MLAALCLCLTFAAANDELPEIRDVHYPDLDATGSRLSFSFQGDIWIADLDSGISRRLTVSDAYESRPRFSPDGGRIAFVSNRYGNSDIFVMSASGGHMQRVTYHSGNDTLSDWSPDGSKLLFSSSSRDHRYTSAYEIELATGYVRPIVGDVCSVSVTGYSPDGKRICGIRRGKAWWRKGYLGSSNAQLMVYDMGADSMEVLTEFAGMDNWPVFSADGSSLYYISERDGRPNVFSMDLRSRVVKPLSRFDKDAVTFLSISGDGKWLTYEWNFDVYMQSVEGGAARKLTLYAPVDHRKTFETEETVKSGIEEMEVNRDGSLVAIRLKDDIFFVKPEFKNDSIRITDWPGLDGDYFWSPDGKTLAYLSQINGTSDIWVVDGETHEKRCLVRDDAFYLDMIGYTRDGKSILFRHGEGGDGIFAADAQTGEVSQFLAEPDVANVKISPDGRWLLAEIHHPRAGTDLHIKPVEGGEWINITQHPDGNWGCHWSPDGKRVLFVSRRDGNHEIYSIDLKRQPQKFEDYEEQIAEKEKKKAEAEKKKKAEADKKKAEADKKKADEKPEGDKEKPEGEKPDEKADKDAEPKKAEDEKEADEEKKDEEKGWEPKTIDPFEIDFQRIERRAKRVTNSSDSEGNIMFLPDGKTIVYTRGKELWAMDSDGKNQRRYITGSFSFGNVRLTEDGKTLFFVDGGKLRKVSAKGGKPAEISWKVKRQRDQRVVQKEAFRQAWALLDERFYAAGRHGADWNAEYARYSEMCDGTLVKDDLHHLIARMIGELNASHLGIYGGPGPSGPSTAALGITADPDHRGPGLRVADVMPDGPADQTDSEIAVGEYIMKVGGEEVGNNEDFHRALSGRSGERVKLLINTEPKLEEAREISIKPVSLGSIGRLRYERWVRDNREMTHRLSDDRVYYAHIEGMNGTCLDRFEREVFGEAQRHDALLIDVRNNGGGHTHDQLLELLSKRVHGWNARRGAPLRTSPYAQFDGPKAVLINQYSSSDAEIFPNGFREKGLGPVIGMTTNGSVIGTINLTLVNGSRFRVPIVGWFTTEGINLENTGVAPDIEVAYPYEAYRDGKDPQIEGAVKALLAALAEGGRIEAPEVNP